LFWGTSPNPPASLTLGGGHRPAPRGAAGGAGAGRRGTVPKPLPPASGRPKSVPTSDFRLLTSDV